MTPGWMETPRADRDPDAMIHMKIEDASSLESKRRSRWDLTPAQQTPSGSQTPAMFTPSGMAGSEFLQTLLIETSFLLFRFYTGWWYDTIVDTRRFDTDRHVCNGHENSCRTARFDDA
jgi:hypothetical protein